MECFLPHWVTLGQLLLISHKVLEFFEFRFCSGVGETQESAIVLLGYICYNTKWNQSLWMHLLRRFSKILCPLFHIPRRSLPGKYVIWFLISLPESFVVKPSWLSEHVQQQWTDAALTQVRRVQNVTLSSVYKKHTSFCNFDMMMYSCSQSPRWRSDSTHFCDPIQQYGHHPGRWLQPPRWPSSFHSGGAVWWRLSPGKWEGQRPDTLIDQNSMWGRGLQFYFENNFVVICIYFWLIQIIEGHLIPKIKEMLWSLWAQRLLWPTSTWIVELLKDSKVQLSLLFCS